MVVGSIMVVQILAHLPLTDINIPANVRQHFQILISIVSFDYFPPFEYLNVGFSEVWAWSPNFEWIGYDSINFLVGLGSIAVFALLQVCTILFTMGLQICKCPCKSLRKSFSNAKAWSSSLIFIHGTFFEILVCVSISMSMVPFWEFFNKVDHASIGITFVFLAILIGYLAFVVFFVVFKSGALAKRHRADCEEEVMKKMQLLYLYNKIVIRACVK